MSTLTPPVQLACPENRHRIEYVLNLVGRKDFDFPSVSSSVCRCEVMTSEVPASIIGEKLYVSMAVCGGKSEVCLLLVCSKLFKLNIGFA